MKVKEIVDLFGGQSALAKLIGIRQSAVSYWVKTGSIPAKWHTPIMDLALEKGVMFDAYALITGAPLKVGLGSTQQPKPDSEAADTDVAPFLFYAAEGGAIKVQVLIGDETVWASQQGIAEIFDTSKQTVSYHITNIFNELELDQKSVVKEFLTTAADGKTYPTQFYNLDAIISLGYRINSYRATQFRRWATNILRDYLIKGFALNDDRLKQGKQLFGKDYFDELLDKIREIRASERRFYQKITDIYAQCSVDYDPESPISKMFYAHVQDKLHFAIHGHTSAEILKLRANASKPHMGLQHWKNGDNGKVTKSDVTVGKNYLSHDEIKDLERLVTMFLDFAENFARRQKTLTMKDWAERLDGFLEFNAYEVLKDFGVVRRDSAERHAIGEYEKFRVIQDQHYKSDFDNVVDVVRAGKVPKSENA